MGVADACVFAGQLSDEQRDQWLDRAHVLAVTSGVDPSTVGGSDGFGIVYLEAGARRLPIVGGLVGGSTDAVIDGVTGILVDAADHVAVARALCTLLSDRELATRLGEAGVRRADKLSWQRMADAVTIYSRGSFEMPSHHVGAAVSCRPMGRANREVMA